MSFPIISIIVPIYNASLYLEGCLASIQKQTFKNLEVILIDDGSIDNSLTISQNFCDQDPRFQLIKKTNGGVSSARNLGLDKATGDYILFVDSDDCIAINHVESLYNAIREFSADICLSDFRRVSPTEYWQLVLSKAESKITEQYKITKQQALEEILSRKKVSWEVCAKLYSAEIIKSLRFNEKEAIGEDFTFAYLALHNANNIAISLNQSYYYLTNIHSATHKAFSQKNLMILTTASSFRQFIIDHYPELDWCSLFFSLHAKLEIVDKVLKEARTKKEAVEMLKMNKYDIDTYLNEIRQDFSQIIFNPKIHINFRFKVAMIKFSKIFYVFWRLEQYKKGK